MAVYFDHHIQPPGLGGQAHHEVEWHGKFSLLAVASKNESTDADGSVSLYLDEGELLEDTSIHRSVVVEDMQWHPEKKIIAIGWRSGEITTYNDHDHEFFEQSSIHRGPITILRWNQNGTRLISADKSGLLVVWKVDSRGQLHPVPLHQHRLSSPLTHCSTHLPLSSLGGARPGDVSVLDAFSWRRKSEANSFQAVSDPIACFCATADGAIYHLNNSGECVSQMRMEGPVHSLLLHRDKQLLVIVTQDMLLSQFSLSPTGQTTEIMQAKLSGMNKATAIIWVADGALASCSDENVIRFWDFDHGDNYVLSVQSQNMLPLSEDVVTSISYNHNRGILAGGMSSGSVFLWQWKPYPHRHVEGAEKWELVTTATVAGPTLQVKWGSKRNLLAVNVGSTVQILTEHIMSTHFNNQVSSVQVSPSEVLVECHKTGLVHSIKTDIQIKGAFVSKEHVAVWSGKRLVVYAFSQDRPLLRVAGSFSTETELAALFEHNLYTVEKSQIHVRTFQGTVKQLLPFSEDEGLPLCLSVSGHFLLVGTDCGFIKMWDLSRREAKMHSSKCVPEIYPECSKIVSVKCNSNASKISIIAVESESGREGIQRLLIWDVESDSMKLFSPVAIHDAESESRQQGEEKEEEGGALEATLPQLADSALREQVNLARELLGRQPVAQFWDPTDPRLLVVDLASFQNTEIGIGTGKKGRGTNSQSRKYDQVSTVVSSIFVTQDSSVLLNEVLPLEPSYSNLMGIHAPFLYFSKKAFSSLGQPSPSQEALPPSPHPVTVARVTMQGFVGLERSDPATLQAMMEFSFHSTMGNMDEAFRAIKLIKSESVWENMARMCVKTRRLDVAAVCLGNMGNARAARAVREAQKIPETEARLAVLAVQLGMLEEAEELYKQSKRFDLLNQFYQASGIWPKAIEVAEIYDRMHLKTTYYRYAKHAEAMGEYTAAINSYEKSETHCFEVPRMLLEDPVELENYVMKSKDKDIRRWWAEYLESMGEVEQALQFYETASDYTSIVRLLCFNGNYERAAEVAEESGSQAAAYHLARRLSMDNGDVKRAIHFFTKAQCYSPAIQLAKEHGLDNELMNLALLSSQEDMMDAAKYYEENPETQEKAIVLYHKAGEISRALELCFQHQQFDTLHQIAEDLGDESSPEMISKVADYFLEHSQLEKAVELLVKSRKFHEALDLCVASNITITEELAEQMTIAKIPNESAAESERRVQLLERLGECCANQGSYHLATKKYTQAGNKTQAMKCLLKSGDTEKIVFFAGVSRQRDIYIMAANYLQTLDWRKDPDVMKNIISFYTKGRAMESLAGFYDACGQVEIDEYQNYDKAAGALSEALKCLGKAKTKNPAALEAKINFLKERVELVKRFANARRVYGEDPEECIRQCQALLDEPNLDTAVRTGDVYGLMVEHYAQAGRYEQAYSLMEEMRQRLPTVNMAFYVDIKTIEAVHSALGIPLGRGIGAEMLRGAGKMRGVGGGSAGAEEESEGEESVGEEVEEGY